jgi:malonate decarboxylase alpha subunit
MSEHTLQQRTSWTTRRDEKARRMQAVQAWISRALDLSESAVKARLY